MIVSKVLASLEYFDKKLILEIKLKDEYEDYRIYTDGKHIGHKDSDYIDGDFIKTSGDLYNLLKTLTQDDDFSLFDMSTDMECALKDFYKDGDKLVLEMIGYE